jgi:hypothetical protein
MSWSQRATFLGLAGIPFCVRCKLPKPSATDRSRICEECAKGIGGQYRPTPRTLNIDRALALLRAKLGPSGPASEPDTANGSHQSGPDSEQKVTDILRVARGRDETKE